VAEISWLALSEDPRKQTDKFGVVVDFPQARGSLGCQQLHQIYLFVYVDLRIVLANLSLPQ